MNRRLVLAALPMVVLPGVLPGAGRAQPSRAAPAVPLALPAGMSPLAHGAYRVVFRAGQAELPAGVAGTLGEIGARLAGLPVGRGRVTVEGQASGPSNDASVARRVALARAQAVRAALVAGGLDETRVDVRGLGRTSLALDCADILPPDAPRTGQTR